MRFGDVLKIYCPRCACVSRSETQVCDVQLAPEMVIDNILCTVCSCGQITALASRDAVRVDRFATGLAIVKGRGKAAASPPAAATGGAPAELPSAPRAGQIFYVGMGVGTALGGLAFSWPEHTLPVFLSFAVATALYSSLLRR